MELYNLQFRSIFKIHKNAFPHLVNHTTRPGFEFASNNYSAFNIYELQTLKMNIGLLGHNQIKLGFIIKAIDFLFMKKKEKIKQGCK